MNKIQLIGWAFLLILFSASALTMTVNSEQEAITKFAENANPTKGECSVIKIEKITNSESEINNLPYTITYQLRYTVFNETKRDVNFFKTTDITDKSLETSVGLACDAQWNNVTSIKASKEKLEIVIRPESNIFNRIYDTISQTWKNKSEVGVEETGE